MTIKRIYILNGHPAESSLSKLFAEKYSDAAEKAGHDLRITHLHDLDFDPDFENGGYKNVKPLEPDLEVVLDNLKWSEHVVVLTPMWWGGLPAKLKGLIDRILLPGEAFDTRNTSRLGLPSPLLKGRSARVIMTSDTPNWFFRFIYKYAMVHQLRGQILGFVGFKPTRITHFSGASHPEPATVEVWSKKISELGTQAA
ncbi:NAD(P)H-dependent oxidoreductase [Cohaesibacter gelatinilyticus]|uniref:Putative NADPH-quinone reductase (Modulator of drug activity B) n=1 Tax=Cohaesibacter gelatinilyticus TaxID=372072 RepID=A0A285PE78_9HYPH|nr:NAD(P)H-dependent oxidoreductase [Cohaesibacter gelatinilyticus]SNZ19497.1 Putative NADPH-quinone reductase (modulator of drug activity B) [Cohaesibacter gelatinilyticus]